MRDPVSQENTSLKQTKSFLDGRYISRCRESAGPEKGGVFLCVFSFCDVVDGTQCPCVSVKLCTTKSHCQSFSISQELALEGQIIYPDPGVVQDEVQNQLPFIYLLDY